MHSKLFYIASDINNKSEFEEIPTPSEDEICENISQIADYVVEENETELQDSINWLSESEEFLKISKDEIGFYFVIMNKELAELQEKIYKRIKTQITDLVSNLSINNKNQDNIQILWQISDIAYPRYEMMIKELDDYPESVNAFILSLQPSDPFESPRPIKYYFIKSYDYHY